MNILLSVSSLALRGAVQAVSEAGGFPGGAAAVDGVVRILHQRFADHSQALVRALERSCDKGWKAIEIALAGDSWWSRITSSGDERGFRDQLRHFLDSIALPPLPGG